MLRGLEFERGAERSFAVWLANSVYWEVTVKRRERISLTKGEFDAWRVRAWPNFHLIGAALDRVVGLLLPSFVLHFHAGPPYRFLRLRSRPVPFDGIRAA